MSSLRSSFSPFFTTNGSRLLSAAASGAKLTPGIHGDKYIIPEGAREEFRKKGTYNEPYIQRRGERIRESIFDYT